MQEGRLSPFALYVRKFLGLNSQFFKVTVLTLGSQYPQIASLVVRSKWSVNTPGNSSFFCSERRDVTYRQLLHSALVSTVLFWYLAAHFHHPDHAFCSLGYQCPAIANSLSRDTTVV